MALFRVFRGPEEQLDEITCHNGYAYFTTDLGNLYIDIGDGDVEANRIRINARYAEALRKINPETNEIDAYINFDDIALKSAIQDVAHGGTGLETLTPNAIIIGNGTDNVKFASIPHEQFVVGDTENGVVGKTADEVRTLLQVYDQATVDNKIASATTVAYTPTLSAQTWVQGSGEYTYTLQLTSLKCGSTGNVPPLISCLDNVEEYSYIESAECNPDSGIIFHTKTKPNNNIQLVVIDLQ